jgi:heme-degrading monooxygenase HmoA
MFEENQLYSSGIWKVKNGQEENFKSVWKEFAETAFKNQGVLEARLLQEVDNSKNFFSLGLWIDAESTKKWQNSSEFKSYMSKFNELCDSMQIKILKSLIKIKK